MKEKIAKIGWKNIVLVVLAVLLVISASQLHTLRKEYKKVYSQNMELNSKMAELKEKNASLEAQIQSAGEMSSSDTDSACLLYTSCSPEVAEMYTRLTTDV